MEHSLHLCWLLEMPVLMAHGPSLSRLAILYLSDLFLNYISKKCPSMSSSHAEQPRTFSLPPQPMSKIQRPQVPFIVIMSQHTSRCIAGIARPVHCLLCGLSSQPLPSGHTDPCDPCVVPWGLQLFSSSSQLIFFLQAKTQESLDTSQLQGN